MKVLSCAAILLATVLAVPMSAHAVPVAWKFEGTLTQNSGLGPIPGASVGDSFSFVLHFDTSTPVTNQPCNTFLGGPDTVCRHNNAPVASQYVSDLRFGNYMQAGLASDTNAGNTITVRNNVLLTYPLPTGDRIVDGYTFGFNFIDNDEVLNLGPLTVGFLVILRGFEDLNIVTDGRVLPTDPLPGLLALQEHGFQGCRSTSTAPGSCNVTQLEGTFSSIRRVPEPGSLALVGLALAGLATVRRRRR